MIKSCLFCQIATNDKPSNKRYEDDLVVAFDDIYPKAKIHILIVPKKHIASTADIKESDKELAGHMILVAKGLAEELGIDKTGYRLIFNTKDHGGQIVDHIHLHLIGGQKLGSMV